MSVLGLILLNREYFVFRLLLPILETKNWRVYHNLILFRIFDRLHYQICRCVLEIWKGHTDGKTEKSPYLLLPMAMIQW